MGVFQNITWAPKVCKIMAFMAVIRGLGLLFYLLLGSSYRGRVGSGRGYIGAKPLGFGVSGFSVEGFRV